MTLLPRLKSICVFPPAATATYCLPFTMYDTGGALTPAPAWYCHSTLPVAASSALKNPVPSPKNTRPPAVASAPPIRGCSVSYFHATLPASALTAESRPHRLSLALPFNPPASPSLLQPAYPAAATRIGD